MKTTKHSKDLNKIREEAFGFLDSKKDELSVYSPYSFLNQIDSGILSNETFIKQLKKDISEGSCNAGCIEIEGSRHFIFYRRLDWDSEYFKREVYRIELILADHKRINVFGQAVRQFIDEVIKENDYFFINIPSEDLTALQGLAFTGFRLVETRLNYFYSDFEKSTPPARSVRRAKPEDIPSLKNVAIRMRNRFDRVHADPAFAPFEGDSYLGTFIEESVKGFADMVFVPDLKGIEPFGFLAANNPIRVLDYSISKLVLAAVDNSVHKGWLYDLLSAVIYEEKLLGADYLTTITQSTNRAAIHTWEKAGFRLGYVTHVFSFSKR